MATHDPRWRTISSCEGQSHRTRDGVDQAPQGETARYSEAMPSGRGATVIVVGGGVDSLHCGSRLGH
jgi:hypothetical protein